MFVTDKDGGLIPFVLTQILDACVNGVTLSDPDLPDAPIVYANKAFEDISGYSQEEILGRNCRFMQGEDHAQPGLQTIREAMAKHEPCTVTLRNYRKNDRENNVIYYLGVQYDVTHQVKAKEEIDKLYLSIDGPGGA